MSRIQDILEKAEREGATHRMRTMPEPAAAAVAPVATQAIDRVRLKPDIAGAESVGLKSDTTGVESVRLTPDRTGANGVPETIRNDAAATRESIATRLDPRLVAGIADAVAAEQYRALRTRIFHSDNGGAVAVLLVTSPGRGEGKTLTAGNLGLTMAQEFNRRICVVDANFRDPQLHRLFGVPDGIGLSDVLVGAAVLDEALVTLDEHHITVLPAGAAPAHPAELLGTTTMRRTVETLRSRFDCVLVDAPAVGPLADVGVLTPLVDRVLLVVRAGVTPRPAIHDAVAAIDASRLLGIVLNDAAAV